MTSAGLTPVERAKLLREQADFLLSETRFFEIFAPYGEVFPCGSYYLDLMAYPDLDVYVAPLTIPQLFEAGGKLASCERVTEVVFQKGTLPDLPGGLYMKPRLRYGDWGRPWKIDIWLVQPEIARRKIAELDGFRARLTPSLREAVLAYKQSILNRDHRTPGFSGYFIYKAFLEEGLTDFAEVTRYLIAHGIKVEQGLSTEEKRR